MHSLRPLFVCAVVRSLVCATLALPLAIAATSAAYAQSQSQTAAALTGTILDPRGVPLPGATVQARNEATGTAQKVTSDSQGKYSFASLPAGKYTIQVDASGFNTSQKSGVQLTADSPVDVPITLALGNASEQITVEAGEVNSPAASLAPMDALLDEHSAHTEITQAFINNYTSPLADFGEDVEMAPGTFTTNGNGPGLGQSKTYFRGFPDGDYDIDFDGIPFYDTNTPTHHSWAFFPSQWLGGIDFDRSPGTASTIGPTPFGGSIHLLSKDVSPVQNIRGGISYGSWGTLLADVQYDSGMFGPGKKAGLEIDVQHMDSKGYESNNFQNRNAGSIKAIYKFSDKTVVSGFSGVVWLDANTPNFNATRCQMYGPNATLAATAVPGSATAYASLYCTANNTATGTPLPYTNAGIRFLLADNTDPTNYLDYQYNYYHVPTDFEYGRLHMERAHNITFDFTPYTYNYDNSEKYTNAVTITESGSGACNAPATKKGVTAIPCGVDKYNSYRKYGETSQVSQVSKFGILHAGVWYEWAATNRHQYPSDPLNHWADQTLPNFAEQFWTNSYQPFVEYQFHVTKALDITPGVKWAYYTVSTKQYADDGKTIGCLVPVGPGGSSASPCATSTNGSSTIANPNINSNAFITNGGSYFSTLPSIDAHYRIRSNWSAYGQMATGSIVPPSSTFDYNQGTSGQAVPPLVLPKQQHNTTWQVGSVVKLKHVTLDVDAFHIRFSGGYSSQTDPTTGEPVYYAQPSSISKGLEGQSNIYIAHGLSAYLNATAEKATYTAFAQIYPNGATNNANPLYVATPANQWVQQTPSDTEAEGLTWLHGGFDSGIFNKRVGKFYLDDSGFHNTFTINPFDITNAYINYTVRSGSRFDQTKIRLSVNNLMDYHSTTGMSLSNSMTPQTFVATSNTGTAGLTYNSPFVAVYPGTNNQTVQSTALVSGQDNPSIFAGRSIVLSITFGLSPKR